MTIYSPSGAVVYEAPITKSAIIRRELMGDYYIELVFDAVDRIDIGRGCYILYNNHRFEIMNNVIPDDTNQGGLRYTLRFESQQSQMKRCNVFWREGDNLEVSFALTSDISTFGQLIIDNVNAFLGGSTFSLGSVPSGAEMKAISFAGDSCWDAMATIAETFGVEWWTEENGDNVRLCFGKLEIGDSVEFKKGDIVSSIPSKKGDDANYGTRFYVFGSTKNLPEDYGSTVEGGITNNVAEKRLHLPNGMQYIDAWPNLTPENIVEKTVFFEDVMPTNVETITEVYSGNAQVIPGTSHKVYDVVCANSPFTLDDVIEGETIQANFTGGSLNGQTFDLELTQTSGAFNKTFRIVPKILDKDSLTILPQGEMIPRAGDTFILLNVNLPKGRIDEAEQRLLEVGQEYVKKNSSDTEIYDCPTNAVYCHKNDCNYMLGQRVTLVGDKFGASGRESRIQGYEKKLYDEYQATYTVGDNSAYSRLASLEKSIQQATYSDRVGLEANIIRSKNDSTIPSDFNIYSALAVEEYFLSKRKGGTVKGHTDFTKGISLYGKPIYDEEKKSWILEGDLLVTGAITMYGLTEGYKPSTIMDAVKVDGNTIIKENGVLKINPNINLGGGSGGGTADSVAWINVTGKPTWITDNKPTYSYSEILNTPDLSVYATQSWVTGKGYITASALEPYALKTAIPTNTNQLNNGAGFITGITSSMVTTALGYTPLSTGGGTINGDAKITNDLYLGGVLRNANATWLLGESAPDGTLTIGSGSYAQERCLNNYNGKLRLTAEGGVEAQLTYLDSDPTLGALDTKGVVRQVAGGYGWGLYSWVRNTGNGYIQVGSDSRYAVSEAFNLILQVLGGNVAIGGTAASEKLHVHGNILASGGITCRDNFRTNDNYYGFSVKSQGSEDNWYGVKTYMQFDEGTTMGVCRIGTAYRHQGLAISFSTGNAYNYNIPSDYTYTDAMLLDKNGNLKIAGAITMYYSSDKRLKQSIRQINASEVLMSLGGVYQYEYIDSEVAKNSTYEGSHYGLIYQNVKGTALSTMCHEREDGFGTLNYLDTNFISLIAGATMENINEVEKLKRKIRSLEAQVKQLESRA